MDFSDADADAAVALFKRSLEAADLEKQRYQSAVAAAYRALPPVTFSEAKTESTGFQPIADEAPRYSRDPACQCTEDELWSIWNADDPAHVIFVKEQFPTTVPGGYARRRACLRFAKIEDGAVIPFDILSSAAIDALAGLPDGCYAVQFYGYRLKHGPHHGDRDWHPSTVDFMIYRLICNH